MLTRCIQLMRAGVVLGIAFCLAGVPRAHAQGFDPVAFVRATGYDLVRHFQGTVGFLWSAPQSQIYPELRRMEAAGLVKAQVAPRGLRAQKRIYSVTDAGMAELRRWATDFIPLPAQRDPVRPVFHESRVSPAKIEPVTRHRAGFGEEALSGEVGVVTVPPLQGAVNEQVDPARGRLWARPIAPPRRCPCRSRAGRARSVTWRRP